MEVKRREERGGVVHCKAPADSLYTARLCGAQVIDTVDAWDKEMRDTIRMKRVKREITSLVHRPASGKHIPMGDNKGSGGDDGKGKGITS